MRGLILLALNLCATAFFLMGGILVILVGTWIKDLPVEDRLNLPRWEIFVVAGLTVALFAYFAAATAWLRSEHFGSLSGSKKSNKNPKMASNDVQQLLPLDPDHGRAKNVCYINHIYPIEKTVFLTAVSANRYFCDQGNDFHHYSDLIFRKRQDLLLRSIISVINSHRKVARSSKRNPTKWWKTHTRWQRWQKNTS